MILCETTIGSQRLPVDHGPLHATLLSLPPAPLLKLVCRVAQRQLTAIWLALANSNQCFMVQCDLDNRNQTFSLWIEGRVKDPVGTGKKPDIDDDPSYRGHLSTAQCAHFNILLSISSLFTFTIISPK
jgi:hypothetical protein